MGKAKILIVEDERIVTLDIQDYLVSLGYEVSATAVSGEEAIRKAAQTNPDLVLMDVKLKGEMDGVEAAEQIQARLGVPVIYMSAFSDWTTIQRAKATRPFAYLLKPVEESHLSSILEMALYQSTADKASQETTQGCDCD
jgi:CheY-like chemotaxis protein